MLRIVILIGTNKPIMLSAIRLSVIMQSVIMQSVIMLSVIVLSVIMLSAIPSVIMLSVIMPNVVVPSFLPQNKEIFLCVSSIFSISRLNLKFERVFPKANPLITLPW